MFIFPNFLCSWFLAVRENYRGSKGYTEKSKQHSFQVCTTSCLYFFRNLKFWRLECFSNLMLPQWVTCFILLAGLFSNFFEAAEHTKCLSFQLIRDWKLFCSCKVMKLNRFDCIYSPQSLFNLLFTKGGLGQGVDFNKRTVTKYFYS